MSIPHFKELDDLGWILEALAERFNNALELMADSAVVYGGGPRDVIAGLPLTADLDMAAGARSYIHTIEAFGDDPHWAPKDKSLTSPPVSASFGRVPNPPISDITEYVSSNGSVVQIMKFVVDSLICKYPLK